MNTGKYQAQSVLTGLEMDQWSEIGAWLRVTMHPAKPTRNNTECEASQ